jgi:hypothetical protein
MTDMHTESPFIQDAPPSSPYEATFTGRARELVYAYVKAHLEKTDTHVEFRPDMVYVVSFCYILGNWKALVSTTLPDGMYYEVTHDAISRKDYVDAYKKFDNREVPEQANAFEFFGVQVP